MRAFDDITPTEIRALSVQHALAAVMYELPSIGKADKSPEGYAYRGIEAITKHLQPLLARWGVVIVPSATITQVVPSPAMKDGWQDVYMQVDWKVYGPDGSFIEARTNGVGRDRSDKGSNKAQTQALKYLLLQLLCISDKADDADGQTYEHDRVERPAHDPDAVRVFEKIKSAAQVNAAAVQELKAFAATNHQALTLNALADAEWRATVESTLELFMDDAPAGEDTP